MMIKANGEYLDFDGEITLEKQIKLFEDISTSDGDFSYAFEVPKTINNTRIFRSPFPDNKTKLVYQQIPAELISDDGVPLYYGYIRIEQVTDVYECSFFSGNNNWFSIINGSMQDLSFPEYEKDIDFDTITESWNDTSGVKYPLVDAGVISTRSINVFHVSDFIPFMFVHTVMEKIFRDVGIMLAGELINDPTYQKLMFATCPISDQAIIDRSSYAGKDLQVLEPVTHHVLTFPDDSTPPFYDGVQNNYDATTSTYTADTAMIVTVEFALNFDDTIRIFWWVRINGVETSDGTLNGDDVIVSGESMQIILRNIQLSEGDTIDMTARYSVFNANITSGYLKITPTTIYRTFSEQLMPNWSKQKFVSNVFKLFNVIASYDPKSRILSLNLFENINKKESIDLSEYISETEVDYVEFISNYATKSRLRYQALSGFDEIDKYNDINELQYGDGEAVTTNEFLEQDADVIQSDFVPPFDYYNGNFDLPLARLNFNSSQEAGDTFDVTQVDDASGTAEFVVGNGHGLFVGDIVRITESTIPSYNGEHVVSSLVSTDRIHLYGISYNDDADLKLVKLVIERESSDSVFIALDTGGLPDDESFYTGKTEIIIAFPGAITGTDAPALAFFNMPDVGRAINTSFVQSLSFGPVNLPNRYQRTLTETFYRLFEQILNDPVKLKSAANIPYSVFLGIDFQSPIYIKTLETVNLYYMNRATDYQSPYQQCTLELIKI